MANTVLKPHIPPNPTVFDPNSSVMKSWFKQIRDYCFRSSSTDGTLYNAAFTLAGNYFYGLDATAAPFNITLPPSQWAGQGREYAVYVRVQGPNPVTFVITAGSGDTIAAASSTVQFLNDKALWYTDGAGTWFRLI